VRFDTTKRLGLPGGPGVASWRTTMSDTDLLDSLDAKLQIVRDRTRGVALGYSTGFYLWGEGGTSKSFTVEFTLKQLARPFKLSNSRLTGRGLFNLLGDYPDLIHVLDDVETLFSDKHAFGVLRSALWGQAGADGLPQRVISWGTHPKREEITFTGGIIMVANLPSTTSPPFGP
jgi:hypothetical protein